MFSPPAPSSSLIPSNFLFSIPARVSPPPLPLFHHGPSIAFITINNIMWLLSQASLVRKSSAPAAAALISRSNMRLGQLCLRCTAGGQRTALTLAGAPRTQLASSAQQDRASGLNAQRRHDMKTVASRSALASSNHSPLPAAGSRRCSSAALEGGDWACVIFDMGGTLFEHQTMLTRFAQHMIRQLTTAAGPEALEGWVFFFLWTVAAG